MKKKNSKNTRILRLCSLLILIPILLLSACNKNGNNATQTTTQDPNPPRKVTVGMLFHEIQQNASPAPQKPSEDLNDIEVGRIPIEYLEQAPQDLVGEKLQLSFEEMLEGTIIYRYNATTKQLVIMYYKNMHQNTSLRTMAMLVMQTDYADMKDFLSLTDLWTGTVTAVKIVGGNDIDLSRNSLYSATVKATEASTVCYGRISYKEKLVAYDSVQPNNEHFGYAFDKSVARFGIE